MAGLSTASSGGPTTRPLFRFLASTVALVSVLFGVASLVWDLGEVGNTTVLFFSAGVFAYIAAGDRFGDRTARRRMQLHGLARLYVAKRMTLEEFGERTRQVLDRNIPSK